MNLLCNSDWFIYTLHILIFPSIRGSWTVFLLIPCGNGFYENLIVVVFLVFSRLSALIVLFILFTWGHTYVLWGCWCAVKLQFLESLKWWIFASKKAILYGYNGVLGVWRPNKYWRVQCWILDNNGHQMINSTIVGYYHDRTWTS